MRVPFSNLLAQYEQIKTEIDDAISQSIQRSLFIGGEAVEEFERLFRKMAGTDFCISCANGTDALYIAMRGMGLKSGDEVITTAHSWFSTSEAITQAGGTPIFCDTTGDGFCIDPDFISEKITEKTVGILPVHLYGHPAEMARIMKIAQDNGLWVIEDCAQAHLARLNDRNVGTFGHAATYSFYPGKNLGAMGDAGAIVTNNAELAEWCSLFARHGGKGRHLMEGINSRMDAMQAAVLNAKMPYLPKWTEQRVAAAKYYSNGLSGIDSVSTPITQGDAYHVFHLYTIICDKRDELRIYLERNGVQTNVNYPIALPFLPPYSDRRYGETDFPAAHRNQSEILSLPIFAEISTQEQDYVIGLIRKFYRA